MPRWLDDSHIDCQWLKSKSCKDVDVTMTCSVKDISNQGRLGSKPRDGATLLLTLQDDNSETTTATTEQLVIKQIPKDGIALSRQLGLAREALFYKTLAPTLMDKSGSGIPQIFYAYGNMETGEKVIVMEALPSPQWLDSGIFFGPGNPNNWKRDLQENIKVAYGVLDETSPSPPSSFLVAKTTFVAIAKTHASFWKQSSLLDPTNDWLRGQKWLQGQGKDSWEASQELIRGMWNKYTSSADETPSIDWNPIVRATVDKAVKGISWQAQLDRLNVDGRWTLVHGDFWPGNVMWNTTDNESIRLLDWEMVGLGSGPQDLGQYVLSNMDPVERRACEHELVQAYYEELVSSGVAADEDGLWDYCWREYKVGGLERWLWFLVYFVAQPSMTDWAQFFHNQIAAFMEDHELTAVDITQPRP